MNNYYDVIGKGYTLGRRTDPLIAAQIHHYLSGAESIINIGAGTGSYEPKDRVVQSIEPSSEMIRQRPENSNPVIQASAEHLPMSDNSFSHAMTILSMHHWIDRSLAFKEIKRVVRQRFVALTWDPDAEPYWLTKDYFPEIHDIDKAIFPSLQELKDNFPNIKFHKVAIPANCVDGFTAAYWARPHAYLDPNVRACMSTFSKIIGVDEGIRKLELNLENGDWHKKNQQLSHLDSLDVGYRLAVWDVN